MLEFSSGAVIVLVKGKLHWQHKDILAPGTRWTDSRIPLGYKLWDLLHPTGTLEGYALYVHPLTASDFNALVELMI